jgi:flagellar basal body rod protein FlgG
MLRGLYSAATGLEGAARNQHVVAQNLAHSHMPGYQRRVLAFETFDQTLARFGAGGGAGGIVGTQSLPPRVAFESGPLQFTGTPLDLALRGDGFFVLDGPNGPLYTRNGVFRLSEQGELLSYEGLAVRGTGGPMAVPPGTSTITVLEDGSVIADGASIGQLQRAQFQNNDALIPVGMTLFEAPPGIRPGDAASSVAQGYREGSNVPVIYELVQMIAGLRHYEASQRALRAISEAIELNTRPQTG